METQTENTFNISDIDNMDGLEFEEFCCELFKRNGYINIKKTQASGDYGLDVIATKDDIKYGIQCKNYKEPVGVSAVQEANTGSNYYNCDIAIVITNSTFTRQAIEMARETKVKLWDRNKLAELMLVFPRKSKTSKNSVNVTQNNYVTIGKLENWIKNGNIKCRYTYFSFKQLCSDILRHNEFNIIKNEFDIFQNTSSQPYTQYIVAERADIKYHIYCNFEKNVKENPVSEKQTEMILEYLISKQKQDVVSVESRSVILTNGLFTKGAAEKAEKKRVILWDRDKFIELLKSYPTKDYISDCAYIKKIIDNDHKKEMRQAEIRKEVSNTPHLAIISVVLSVICLIITAIGKESILNIISLIISGISVVKYGFTAMFEMQESQKESLKSYEERVSKASKKAKIGALLSCVSVMIMSIIMVITID